jgi:hypothetical protein
MCEAYSLEQVILTLQTNYHKIPLRLWEKLVSCLGIERIIKQDLLVFKHCIRIFALLFGFIYIRYIEIVNSFDKEKLSDGTC